MPTNEWGSLFPPGTSNLFHQYGWGQLSRRTSMPGRLYLLFTRLNINWRIRESRSGTPRGKKEYECSCVGRHRPHAIIRLAVPPHPCAAPRTEYSRSSGSMSIYQNETRKKGIIMDVRQIRGRYKCLSGRGGRGWAHGTTQSSSGAATLSLAECRSSPSLDGMSFHMMQTDALVWVETSFQDKQMAAWLPCYLNRGDRGEVSWWMGCWK